MGTELIKRRQELLTTSSGDPEEQLREEARQLHMNYIQLVCFLVGAASTYVVAGRGTGKTEGILAPKLHRLLTQLRRSSIGLIGATYVQLTNTTLPQLLAGMNRLGYEADVDYWARKFPPKKLGLQLPYSCPLDPQHAVFIRNPGANSVSAVRLISLDRPGSANGMSLSALIGDEAKLLDKEKLDSRVMPVNRGGAEHFGDIAEHHSVTFTTDMPTDREGSWILKNREESAKPHHKRAIELILAIQLELYRERRKLLTNVRNAARRQRIARYERQLEQLRKNLVHFAAASSFANVHVLGLKYFKDAYRTNSPSTWKAAYLNEEPDAMANAYYPDLLPEKHYYDGVDYSFIDARVLKGMSFDDCRADGDLDHSQGLTIGCDYGSSFNCLHVGQRVSKLSPLNMSGKTEVRHLRSFGLPEPHLIQDVVKLFTDYYAPYLRKHVTYVYDPTAVGKMGVSTMTYASEVIKALKAAGWVVKQVYFNRTPSHHSRYMGWGVALREDDDRFAVQRFNRVGTRASFTSMIRAKTKQGKNGFEKDKDDEQNKSIDQSTTTHYSDAVDHVFWYLTIIEPGCSHLLPATS